MVVRLAASKDDDWAGRMVLCLAVRWAVWSAPSGLQKAGQKAVRMALTMAGLKAALLGC